MRPTREAPGREREREEYPGIRPMYRIVIVEDYTILREGLKSLLSSHPEFKIVGEAEDGLKAISCVEEHKPDLILMDLSMPRMNGIEAIREVKRVSPKTKVLPLTVHDEEEYVLTTFRAGADGYALKDSTQNELISAIRNVLAGKPYVSPGISGKVIHGYLEGKRDFKLSSVWEVLSPREREVLKLIAEGYKSKEIADYLYVSPHTVERHRSNLMKKLDLHSVQALTTFAFENGIV